MVIQAMVLANETLFVAGPPVESNRIPQQPIDADPFSEALEARGCGKLRAVSADNGKTLADYDLKSSPVFDGMATAYGRLYISMKDGSVLCLADK